MVYCQNSQSKTKAVTLVFKREELLYDAENYSFVEGDIMQAEDEHARHQVFDIGQDGNVDRVTRILNLVHSECVEIWGIERSGFFNGREKWAKGFENQRV